MTEDPGALALRLTVLDLLKDRVAGGIAATKADAEQAMTVGDRKVVPVPTPAGPTKVATVTYVEGRSGGFTARFDDFAAFTKWAQQNAPDAVSLQPVVAEWFITEAQGRALNGEVIPGIEVNETGPGKPYVRVQRDKSPEAAAALLDFLFNSPAEAVANFRSLLALEPPASTE